MEHSTGISTMSKALSPTLVPKLTNAVAEWKIFSETFSEEWSLLKHLFIINAHGPAIDICDF